MIPAKALFYAMLIALIMAMITSSFIGLAYFQRLRLEEALLEESLARNVRSGVALLLQDDQLQIPYRTTDLFGVSPDSVSYEKYLWGLLAVGNVTAFHGGDRSRQSLSKSFLIGQEKNKLLDAAVYLADLRKPLTLVGDTRIKGTAILPRAGAVRGYIGGEAYRGDQLIYGLIRASNNSIPLLPKTRIQNLFNQFNRYRGSTSVPNPLRQSFRDSTVYLSGSTISLQGLDLSGRVIVQATDSIYVGASARLENVLLFAPKIYFEEGFKGKVQAFATKEIIVSPEVQLDYPSVLGLGMIDDSQPKSTAEIQLMESSSVAGLIFAFHFNFSRIPVRVHTHPGSLLKGQLIVEGNVEHEGSVFGNITNTQYTLKTPSTVYSNHLFNAVIDRTLLEDYYCSPLFLDRGLYPQKIVSWVN